MLRIALLSKWHVHAEDYCKDLLAVPDVEIGAVWDEEPARGEQWARELDAPFERDLHRLLAREDIDGVVVTCPTTMHREVIVKAAESGKHIYTEKVLAPTLAECQDIRRAVERAGVVFSISTPYKTLPEYLFAKQLVEEGALGKITSMRLRSSHDGASSGWLPSHFFDPTVSAGGAMLDLGCHAMYMSHWLLGEPISVTSLFTRATHREVEDNAVSLVEYPGDAIAVLETGFVSNPKIRTLELHGTEGSLRAFASMDNPTIPPDVRVYSMKDGGREGWVIPAQMPQEMPLCIPHWVECIREGKEPLYGMDSATTLTKLMQGAYQSWSEGRKVLFSELDDAN